MQSVAPHSFTERQWPFRFSALASLLALTLLVGCATPEWNMDSPAFKSTSKERVHVVFRTVGPPGQVFSGVINVDGKPVEVSGVSPLEFPFDCTVITGELKKVSGEGSLSFEIAHDTSTVGFGTLTRPGRHLRFGYHDNGVECVQ